MTVSHVSPFPAVSPSADGSPYLSLRRAVRPAMFAYRLLAGDAERAGSLAAECEDLLRLTRELLTAAGRVRLLVPSPGSDSLFGLDDSGGGAERQAELLNAYADAAMGWAKVIGGLAVLGGRLVEHGDWDEVRRLADLTGLREMFPLTAPREGLASKAAELRKMVFWALTLGQSSKYLQAPSLLFAPIPKTVLIAAEKTLDQVGTS